MRRSALTPFTLAPLGLAAALLAAAPARAVELPTGNPDLSIRWDNTLRLNLGVRVESRDPKIANTAIADEGDYSFGPGDFVAKRLDLLSEFDVVYRKRFGARVSAAGWYDGAYGSHSPVNPNAPLNGIPSYVGNEYSPLIKRLYGGPSGEFLDAFVFGGFDIGEVPVQAKLGRHTVYWGESLFLGGHLHSVAYAQNPLDLQKGFATPGVEAKELFRPINQLSMQAQITPTFSVAGQYMLDWESARYPEGGTYLGPVDFVFNGPDRQFLSAAMGFASRGPEARPPKRGEWGLAARWSPEALDGTVGFYYRRFADKLPQVLLTQVPPTGPAVYNYVYADDIQLFGVSLAKNIGGVSVGAEVSYRRNTPLNSRTLGVAPGMPAEGETKGARGDTWHALVNLMGAISSTPVFDSASWAVELQAANWSKLRSGGNLFNAVGFASCAGKDKWDGCVTRNYLGGGVSFTPSWFQVLPGVDLTLPLTYSIGLSGNSPVTNGGNQALGNYSIGLGADVRSRYRFDLKYIDYVGRYRDNGSAVTSANGLTTYLRDRGFISLTFKTTF